MTKKWEFPSIFSIHIFENHKRWKSVFCFFYKS